MFDLSEATKARKFLQGTAGQCLPLEDREHIVRVIKGMAYEIHKMRADANKLRRAIREREDKILRQRREIKHLKGDKQ